MAYTWLDMKSRAPLGLLVLALAARASAAAFVATVSASKFLKGNLHSHSNDHAWREYADGKGDGDSPPGDVMAWYAGHGYGFDALTDHNELTTPAAAGLTALRGIEITSYYGPKQLPVHAGAVCVSQTGKGTHSKSGDAGAMLQATVAAARAAGAAFVVVNHPNYEGGLGKGALTSASGYDAIEIASGHPEVERDDASASESAESLWDDVLSSGRDVWGVAADDSHDFKGQIQKGESALRAPGRAWVQVWAPSDSAEDVCAALKDGRFYSSMGPEMKSLSVAGGEIAVEVAGAWDKKNDKIEFIKQKTGRKESVVSTSSNPAASYDADGTEGYVRVRVTQAGKRAWTQAYRVKP